MRVYHADMESYTIGQLSRKTGLTRRALRLYEEAELLVPERGEHNQYRYYTDRHLQDAHVIKTLRDSGLSLKSIQRLFAVKRSDLPITEKLQKSEDILDTLHQVLLEKRAAIDVALQLIVINREEIRRTSS